MTLQGFSFGSAAEMLDDDAGEESDGGDVGFGFGDGYDLVAFEAGFGEGLCKGITNES